MRAPAAAVVAQSLPAAAAVLGALLSLSGCPGRPAPAQPRQEVPAACAAHLPFGAPSPGFPGDTVLCRKRMAIAHDPAAKGPRWVAHVVRSVDAWACEDRENQFRADPDLARLRQPRAQLSDYAGSGWHRGHLAADADLRADAQASAEADYLSNVVPQNPAMNIGLWSKIEATVRVWGAERGEVWVLTLPARSRDPERRRAIGSGVDVPDALAKVVIDGAKREGIAFFVPNAPFGWREDPARFVVPFAVVERETGVAVPRPAGTAEADAPWPADIFTFGQTKEFVCAAARG